MEDYYRMANRLQFFQTEDIDDGRITVRIKTHLPRTMFFCDLVNWCQEHDVEMSPTHLTFKDQETYVLFKLRWQ